MQETHVQSLGKVDPLEKGIATYFSISWRIPWREEIGKLQSMGFQRVEHDWVTDIFTFTFNFEYIWRSWCYLSYDQASYGNVTFFFFTFSTIIIIIYVSTFHF